MNLSLLFPAIMCGVFCWASLLPHGHDRRLLHHGPPAHRRPHQRTRLRRRDRRRPVRRRGQAIFNIQPLHRRRHDSEITYASYGGIGLALFHDRRTLPSPSPSRSLMGQTLGDLLQHPRCPLLVFQQRRPRRPPRTTTTAASPCGTSSIPRSAPSLSVRSPCSSSSSLARRRRHAPEQRPRDRHAHHLGSRRQILPPSASAC